MKHALLFMLFAALVAAPGRAAESDIVLKTPTGTIYGTLSLADKLPSPVVLIIAGSGPTDRNGNNPLGAPNNSYKSLADELAKAGISSVRYDKRGIAASHAAIKSETLLRFDDYVNDAAAWAKMLKADARFSKIIIAGHSEGSLIGMIAAQRAPVDGYVSLEGAGRSAPAVLREQLKANAPPDLYEKSDAILTQLQQGHRVPNPPAVLAALFRPSVQPYLISWFKYDPAVEIAKLSIPVLIVQGTADQQVSMVDANALIAHAKSYEFQFVDGMNHVMQHEGDTKTSYGQPHAGPIEPLVAQSIAGFAAEKDLAPRAFVPLTLPADWLLLDGSNNSNMVQVFEHAPRPDQDFPYPKNVQVHLMTNRAYDDGVALWRKIVTCERNDELTQMLHICGFVVDRDEKCGTATVHRFVRDANLGPPQRIAQTQIYIPHGTGYYEVQYERPDVEYSLDHGGEKDDDVLSAIHTWCETIVATP